MSKEIRELVKLFKTIDASNQKVLLIDGVKVLKRKKFGFFLRNGFRCRCCGKKADFARLEKNNGGKRGFYHLVLYVLDGPREIELTVDHIVPKSLGGKDTEENYQLLCKTCNFAKGNEIIVY